MELKKGILYTQFTPKELYAIMYSAERDGAYVVHIRGRLCSTLDGFFCEISSAMRFPYYFGWNWAAFDECITDLEWLKFSSLLIIIDNQELLFTDEGSREEFRDRLLKYLNIAIDYWKEQNILMTVFLNLQ